MLLKLLFLSAALMAATKAPLPTVPSVDLPRYLGTWHEIARYPNFFQENCTQSKAQYNLQPDGSIEVVNTCLKLNGKNMRVLGRAEVVDKGSNAKLRVSFVPTWLRKLGFGWGDYWVVALAPDYSYAVVSEPSRKFLWILNREPTMKPEVYKKLMDVIKELGFEEALLIRA